MDVRVRLSSADSDDKLDHGVPHASISREL
jgi:hypothetical protein